MAVPVTDKRRASEPGGVKYPPPSQPTPPPPPLPTSSAEDEYEVGTYADADGSKLDVVVAEAPDPVTVLMQKTFQFIVNQPEFYHVLGLPAGVRKQIGRDFGKLLTRVPHMRRVLNEGTKEN